MLALVVIDTVVVVLLTGLVAGLVRSHTEILRALRALDSKIKQANAAQTLRGCGAESPRSENHPMTATRVVIAKHD